MNELVVVLGHETHKPGKLSDDALSRLSAALHYIKTHPANVELFAVTTGGFGDHFNSSNVPHGRLLAQQLTGSGFPPDRLLDHIHSCGTLQDALGVLKLVRTMETTPEILTIVTSKYHLERAEYIFSRLFPHTNLKFLSDESSGTRRQRTHEKTRLKQLKRDVPEISSLGNIQADSSNLLFEELKHYDNLSYLALAAAFIAIYIWQTATPHYACLQLTEPSFYLMASVSILFFSIYYRLAGSAESARKTIQVLSFLLEQPHLGTHRSPVGNITPRVKVAAFFGLCIALLGTGLSGC